MGPIVNHGMKAAGLDPVECGRLHATIISSPNAARRPATYFSVDQQGLQPNKLSSVKLEGRLTNSLAYDAEFGQWVQSFLEETIANHTMVVEQESLSGTTLSSRDTLVV